MSAGLGATYWACRAVLVDADGKPIHGEVSDKEILAHLDRHSKAVMKDFYRTSDFCGACHKAALPRMLNSYKWQRAIFLSDEWQQGLICEGIATSVLREATGFYLPDLPHARGSGHAAGLWGRSKAS
ncbi:MAG: hypothetical protein WDM87_10665, partial [Terracidiphilus sp.]